MSTSSYRNLLFGILALQTETITRDQLASAVQAWTIDKSRSLADILVEQQSVDEDNCKAIRVLVESRLALGSKSIAASLTRLDATGDLRDCRDLLSAISGEDLSESLEGLTLPGETLGETRPGSYSHAAGFSSSATTARATTDCRYEKISFLDEGGLGRVYIARDTELGRKVALKELKAKAADNLASQSRFVTEAEITGGLEHPGIVSVYGLGRYIDGRPFYAMQFIQGDNLRIKIAEFYQQSKHLSAAKRSVEIRRLLKHFVDACHAVHYAHMRGVLHRDIKPDNIMVGRYGETLVVDWGLAKWQENEKPSEKTENFLDELLVPLSGSMVADTMLGSALGTPYYMSPEQARGEHDDVGPETDVFSLGATLYVVITNHRPYQDEKDVLTAAKTGKVVRPRAISARVPKPLDAICRKAMAPKPSDRYASALELAEDVEQYLADEKVSANSESIAERAMRLVRRHRGLAVASLLAVTAVAIVAALSAVNIRKEKDRTEAVLEFLVSAFRSPDPSVTGRDVRMAAVLDEAVRKSDDLPDPIAQADLLEAIGKTYSRLALNDEAQQIAKKAYELRVEELGPLAPDTLAALHLHASALNSDGRFKEALPLLEQALAGRLRVLGPDHDKTLKTMKNLADCQFRLGLNKEALRGIRQVIEQRRKKSGEDSLDSIPAMDSLARMLLLVDVGKALLQIQEVVRIRSDQLGSTHAKTLFSKNNLASAYQRAGEFEKTIRMYRDEGLLDNLEKTYGSDHSIYANAIQIYALALQATGDVDEAQRLLEQVVESLQSAKGAKHHETLMAVRRLAQFHLDTNNFQSSKLLLQQVLPVLADILGTNHLEVLAVGRELARALTACGELEDAITAYTLLLEKMNAMNAIGDGTDFETLDTMHDLAETYLQASEFSLAETTARKLLEQLQSLGWAPDTEYVAATRITLADALFDLGEFDEAHSVSQRAIESLESDHRQSREYFRAENVLGAALAKLDRGNSQKQDDLTRAEQLLVDSSSGLLPHREPESNWIVRRALERTIEMYKAADRPEDADDWQTRLDRSLGATE